MAKKVLFLSSANSVRSQMAEAFLRALAGDAFEAYSVGSVPRALDPLAVAVMAERGIDIAGQRPKGLQEFIGRAQFDHVITVCDRDEKACPVFPARGRASTGPSQTRRESREALTSAWPGSVSCATRSRRASATGLSSAATNRCGH